jgi:hypothetical protein
MWGWYINTIMVFLDIIRHPAFSLKQRNVSETSFCLPFLVPISEDRACLYLKIHKVSEIVFCLLLLAPISEDRACFYLIHTAFRRLDPVSVFRWKLLMIPINRATLYLLMSADRETETEFSLRNVVFYIKTGRWIMSRNTRIAFLINPRFIKHFLFTGRYNPVWVVACLPYVPSSAPLFPTLVQQGY